MQALLSTLRNTGVKLACSGHKVLAIIYTGTALGMLNFYWKFKTGIVFPILELAAVESNVFQIHRIETIFLEANLVLACSMLIVSYLILRKPKYVQLCGGIVCGALLLMTTLKFGVNMSFNLYAMTHHYASTVMEYDLSLLTIGLLAFIVLLLIAKKSSMHQ